MTSEQTLLARVAELEAFVRNMANPDNWSDKVANLQWMGKRHAIEYAQSLLKTKEPTKPVEPDVVYDLKAMEFECNTDFLPSMFLWSATPEGKDYWEAQDDTPTQEGRDKIAAMREQFEREGSDI